jgi:signal peptidase I
VGTETVNRGVANELWLQLFTTKRVGWLPVLTDSMAPLIRPGDQVQVSAVAVEEIRFGDIVVFGRGDDLIVHRVLKKWRNTHHIYFLEKGDAGYAYGLINAEKVVGRVTRVKGRGKTFDLRSPPSRLTNLLLSVWFYITAACVNRLRMSKARIFARAAKALYRVVRVTSRFLVMVCFVVWYLSGLLTQDGGEQT